MKVLLKLHYDGTPFMGFQRQPEQVTVQGCLEDVLSAFFIAPNHPEVSLTTHIKASSKKIPKVVNTISAGRTDRGVHAREQIITFEDDMGLIPKIGWSRFPALLNQYLPPEVGIISAQPVVGDSFHPRYSARVRWYRYQIELDERESDPSQNRFYYPLRLKSNQNKKLDLTSPSFKKKLDSLLSIFIGTHDFSAFTTVADSDHSINYERSLYRIETTIVGSKLYIDLFANAFLRGMVRSIVGNALDFYQKNKSPAELKKILRLKDSSLARARVPAKGLFLNKIFYQSIFSKN